MNTRQPTLSCHSLLSTRRRTPRIARLTKVSPGKLQRGIALAMGLLFLLLLTIIGVTSMNTSILQERMAGNMRDLDIALQAAETSLRYGEDQLSGLAPGALCPNRKVVGATPDSNGIWPTGAINIDDPAWWSTWGITLMQDGSTKQVAEASEDPRHVVEWIEHVRDTAVNLDDSYGSTGPGRNIYRISARGVGRTSAAQTVLRNTHQVMCP